ncbi:hypothetical protein R1sor_022138 [Riccia sorocarpa]|uniref:Uncharacterized protein n=1 Tax=Riccia sorocarpa TaxID=122646 RepID=A0ABD3GKY6_9MARC
MCSSKHIIDNRLDRQSSRCLKIAPRNIRIHANGRATVLDENNTQIGKWAGVKPGRAQRSDILSAEVRELVLNWWIEETRVSPIAKQVLKRQNHAIHTLDKTQTEFYELFMLSHSMVMSVHDITLVDEFHAGADHEVLSDKLAVGDVFAVKGSSDEEAQTEYWLLRCTGTKQKITEKEILMAISEVEAPIFERL